MKHGAVEKVSSAALPSTATPAQTGMTLIELLVTMIAISTLALVTLPFVQEARRMLRRAHVKQVCATAVQNKLKDYRSSRLWGMQSGANTAPLTNATPTGPYYSNSTFNWLKARYNFLLAGNSSGCVDLTTNPSNPYGLQEWVDNHGGPSIPANACPEEQGQQCPNTPNGGPRDAMMQNQLGGNQLVLFVNLQVVSRLPHPNPWAPSLVALNGQSLANVYQNGTGGDSTPAGTCQNYPNPNPYDLTAFNSDAGQRYLQSTPVCPNPNDNTQSYNLFDQGGAAIRVIVTGAVSMPVGGLWGYNANPLLPNGMLSNQEFMCQAEEVIAPEELMIRYYIAENSGIYDFHGGVQPGSQPILTNIYDPLQGGKTPVAIAVAPDNSMVYVVDATGGQLLRYFNCSTTSGQLVCTGGPYSWDLGSVGIQNITGIGIDFINFPDILMVAVNGANTIKDVRFDPNTPEAICTIWQTSQRIWTQNISSQRIGGIVVTPRNGVLLFDSASFKLVSPYSSNYTFFSFFSDQEVMKWKHNISAISQ